MRRNRKVVSPAAAAASAALGIIIRTTSDPHNTDADAILSTPAFIIIIIITVLWRRRGTRRRVWFERFRKTKTIRGRLSPPPQERGPPAPASEPSQMIFSCSACPAPLTVAVTSPQKGFGLCVEKNKLGGARASGASSGTHCQSECERGAGEGQRGAGEGQRTSDTSSFEIRREK